MSNVTWYLKGSQATWERSITAGTHSCVSLLEECRWAYPSLPTSAAGHPPLTCMLDRSLRYQCAKDQSDEWQIHQKLIHEKIICWTIENFFNILGILFVLHLILLVSTPQACPCTFQRPWDKYWNMYKTVNLALLSLEAGKVQTQLQEQGNTELPGVRLSIIKPQFQQWHFSCMWADDPFISPLNVKQ